MLLAAKPQLMLSLFAVQFSKEKYILDSSPEKLHKELEEELKLSSTDLRSHAWYHGRIPREVRMGRAGLGQKGCLPFQFTRLTHSGDREFSQLPVICLSRKIFGTDEVFGPPDSPMKLN